MNVMSMIWRNWNLRFTTKHHSRKKISTKNFWSQIDIHIYLKVLVFIQYPILCSPFGNYRLIFHLLLNLELWNILVQFVVFRFWQINAILCCVLESKNNLWVLTGPYVHHFETSVIMQEILTSTMQWKSPLIVIYDDNPVAWLLQESRKVETLIVALTIWINVTRRAFNVSEISRNDRNILTLYLRAEPGRDPAKSEHFHYPQHSDTQTPTFRAKHQSSFNT